MTAKRREKFVQNPVTQRCHLLELDGSGTYCGAVIGDDFERWRNFPKEGIPCGSCLRVRRKRRREVD
jgi:hypothetical protein